MARAGLRFYEVQAQLTATHKGWESSRQVRSVIVGAVDPMTAAQEVSHVAWDCSPGGYSDRRTIVIVFEVINGDNGDAIPTGPPTWVRVEYRAMGDIVTVSAPTYQQLCEISRS